MLDPKIEQAVLKTLTDFSDKLITQKEALSDIALLMEQHPESMAYIVSQVDAILGMPAELPRED